MDWSWQNVIDGNGIGLAVTGMLIVSIALALVSGFIAVLPKILQTINMVFPEPVTAHPTRPKPAGAASDDRAIAAAVAFALHHHNRR